MAFEDASAISVSQLDYLKVEVDQDFLYKAALVLDTKGRPVDLSKFATSGNMQAQTPVPTQPTIDKNLQNEADV